VKTKPSDPPASLQQWEAEGNSGCSKPWVGQNLDEGVMEKFGAVSPVQATGSEFLMDIRTQKGNKRVDFVWDDHCQAESSQSQFLFNRNRNFYF